MIRPKPHLISETGHPFQYHYVTFDSITAFHQFVEQQTKQLQQTNHKVYQGMVESAKLRIQRQSDWYGTPIPEQLEDLNAHTYFLGMHLAKKIQQQLHKKLQNFLQLTRQHHLPKPTLAYNSKGLGVFSFDRAAMGMYRVQPTSKDSDIQKVISQMKIELDTGNKATTIKNVFTHFQNRHIAAPSLQLFIMAGGNAGIQGDGLLYIGLACAELVEFMELRGIPVEVNVLIGTSFEKQQIMAVIRVKRFEDRLDKNQLLLISSDPRYFRFKGFKALIALANYFKLTIPVTLGRIQPEIAKDFVPKISTHRHAVFEQSYTMEQAVNEITQIITTYTKQMKSL